MTTAAPKPRRIKTVRFSPVLLAVALTPVFLQTSTISCKSGDTTLSELELIVQGQDRIVAFDPSQRSYNVSLPLGTDEARVRSVTTDPTAQVWVDVLIGTERFRYLHGGTGGSDLVVPLPPGASVLQVWVRALKGASDHYDVAIQVGNGTDFCFEQPVDCSASDECLTDGVCEPSCDPIDAANGLCDRCSGQDDAVPDGTSCTEGICLAGICQETTPPTVLSVSPADGSVDVPIGIFQISVTFDEDMDRTSMVSCVRFTDSAGVVQNASKSFTSSWIRLVPLTALNPNETYYVHATTDCKDLAGNHLEEEFVSSFTTEDPAPDEPIATSLDLGPKSAAMGTESAAPGSCVNGVSDHPADGSSAACD